MPGNQAMQRYSIPRTGQASLVFNGVRLAFAATYDPSPPETQHREFDVAVYCTQAGAIVIQVRYLTTWPDEGCHDHATIVLAQAHVDAELHRYDPLAHLTDLPPVHLVDELSTAYSRLLGAVVAQLDVNDEMP
jgi:hypothetical protein